LGYRKTGLVLLLHYIWAYTESETNTALIGSTVEQRRGKRY